MMMRSIRLSFSLLILLAGHSLGATHHVGDDGLVSADRLQKAVFEAAAGDTVLVHPGVYTGVLLYINGKDVVLKSTDGPEETILDGEKAHWVIWIRRTTQSSLIEGFTIRNGHDTQWGGGIRVGKSSGVTIRNNVFEGCQAPWGGAVYLAPKSEVIVERNLFLSNVATASGGGLYTQHAEPIIRNNTFVGNNSEKPGSAIGLFWAAPIIEGNLFASQMGKAAVHLMKNAKPVLRCNAYWKNEGKDVSGEEEVQVPTDPSKRTEDPLFADEKLYRLSPGSPYRKSAPCGPIGWDF